MVSKLFSKAWKSSTQTRKQRKYLYNAPLHIKGKFLNTPLSSDLKKEYNFRSIRVRQGDTVKINRGQFKGSSGKVTKVDVAKTYVHVEGATLTKRDGTNSFYPIHPSNVEIIKLDLTDKKRAEKVERLKNN